ncbi:hypothetical protein SAMN05421647_1015 [Marinobacterium stanieri]|uniref:Uncharacterized protein n=2 Tax=Marinobacterium stanieri TaxID=49186 RepID=A0A1N6N4L5_9GAMM|nr:hypothetical protein SAMN05421647_1015 [Marinobacterium stanieri]
MEQYLKKQWAGMMYDFLDRRLDASNSKVTNKLLDDLTLATRKSEELIKVLLKATSSENAEEAIQNVSAKVQAEEFFRLLKVRFGYERFAIEEIDEFEGAEICENWYDYINNVDDFYIDEFEHEDEERIVLWGPNSKGIQIGHYDGDEKVMESDPEFERSYSAFKAISNEERRKLFSSLREGF